MAGLCQKEYKTKKKYQTMQLKNLKKNDTNAVVESQYWQKRENFAIQCSDTPSRMIGGLKASFYSLSIIDNQHQYLRAIKNKSYMSYWQGMNFLQFYYPGYLPIQFSFQNDFSTGYFFNQCPNPDFPPYSPELSLQSPSSNGTEATSKEQEIQPKLEEDQERQQQNQKNLKKHQHAGRNDFSNMFKSFLYLAFKCQKTKNHIKQVIKRKNLPITLNAFSNKLKRKFPDSKTYVGPKEIRNLLLKLEKNEFVGQSSIGKLLRILLKGFLQENYRLYVIKKYKGKNQSKKQIFKKCRVLYQQLFGQDQ